MQPESISKKVLKLSMAESCYFANVGLAPEILKGSMHIVHIRFNFRHSLRVLGHIYPADKGTQLYYNIRVLCASLKGLPEGRGLEGLGDKNKGIKNYKLVITK